MNCSSNLSKLSLARDAFAMLKLKHRAHRAYPTNLMYNNKTASHQFLNLNPKIMKKILFLLLVMTIMTGCSQLPIETVSDTNTSQDTQEAETVINTDWLIRKLTENFAEHNFTLQEMNSQEIGYSETKVLGFIDSGVSVIVFDKNHEVYGNAKNFEEAITRYSTDEYYGQIMLQEKQLNSDELLQYTKSEVMANHGAMKKEYFFTLPNNEILQIKVTFSADPEIDDNAQKEFIYNKVTEIDEILRGDL